MKLIVGTANFLKKYGLLKTSVSREEIKKILKFVQKNKNLRVLDTAFEYDKFLEKKYRLNLNNLKINTKLSFLEEDFKKDKFENKYLNKLKNKLYFNNLEKFETIFVHNFDDIKKRNYNKLFKFMLLLKKKKLSNYTGISIYDPNKLKLLKKSYKVDFVQAPISLFDRRFLSKKINNILKKKNLLLQARSIFLQGTLINNSKRKNMLKFKNKQIFSNFENWCEQKKVENLKVCINFIKDQKNIKSLVIGVENLSQLMKIFYYFKSKKKNIYPRNIFSKNLGIIDPRKW